MADAERFVRSIKSECLAQIIPLGERPSHVGCRAVRFQSFQPPALLGGTSTSAESQAHDVNDHNMAVGENDGKPVYWPESGNAVELPTDNWQKGVATGINNKHEIVGWIGHPGTEFPVVWRLRANPQLGPAPGDSGAVDNTGSSLESKNRSASSGSSIGRAPLVTDLRIKPANED